jgi:Flp pilus assembly protein CpaB
MTYRLRNLTIAIALAVLAAMLTSFYVRQQKEDLQQNQTLEWVYVAKDDIEPGASGDEISGLLQREQVAKSAVAPGAIASPGQIANYVAVEKTYAGEQVTKNRFRAPEQQGIRAQLTGTLRAFQVPGDGNQLLSGTLRDGDHVDVMGSWKLTGGGGSEDKLKITRVVLRDILVLQAPTSALDGENLRDQGSDKTVILAVTDAQAQKLYWIMTSGNWSFQLRPTKDPADSPESFEWSGTMLADGITREKLNRLLTDPFKSERIPE